MMSGKSTALVTFAVSLLFVMGTGKAGFAQAKSPSGRQFLQGLEGLEQYANHPIGSEEEYYGTHPSERPTDIEDVLARYEWYLQKRPSLKGVPLGIAREMAMSQLKQMMPRFKVLSVDSAYWHSIGPRPAHMGSYNLTSGRVCAVAVDPQHPDTVYMGAAEGGVWKTTDGGVDWTPLCDNQPSMSSGALAVDPKNSNIVYWGTGEQNGCGSLCYSGIGIMKSTDGGTTWTKVMDSPQSATYRIIIDPDSTNIVYVAMSNGIFKSTDAGATWTLLKSGNASDLVMDTTGDTTLYAGIEGVGTFKSTDAGAVWNADTTGLPPTSQMSRISLGICLSSPDTLYAGIYGPNPLVASSDTNRVYKSTDAGATWQPLTNAPNYGFGQGWYNNYVQVDPVNPNVVYLGGIDIWRSTDGGANWTDLTHSYTGGPVHPDQHAMDFDHEDPNTIFVGNDGGMYKSTDQGTDWDNLNQSIVTIQYYGIAVDPHSSYVTYGGTQDNGTQRRDSRYIWGDVTGGDGGVVNVDYDNSDTVYGEWTGGYHLKSVDGGHTFSGINNGISGKGDWQTPVVMNPRDPQVLYTGTTKFYKTTNGGLLWNTTTSSAIDQKSSPQNISAIAVAPSNPSYIYVGVGTDGVYKTFTGGGKWQNVTGTLPALFVSGILVNPDSENVAYVIFSGYGASHVFKTENGGGSWTDITSNLPNVPVDAIVMDPHDENTLYIGTDIGVFKTSNDGGTWEPFMNGLPNVAVNGLEFTPNGALRAATGGRGMWEYSSPNNVVLSVTVNPPGAGVITPSPYASYQIGDTVTVTAVANYGYTFGLWGGDTSAHSAQLKVVMWKNKDITANFVSRTLPQNAFYKTENSDRGQVAFKWVELAGDSTATRVKRTDWHNPLKGSDPTDDGTVGPILMHIPFYFYGETQKKDTVYIGANGVLSLSQDNVNSGGYYNSAWTIPGAPIRDLISPFWNDLYMNPDSGANVYYKTDSVNNRFIVEFSHAKDFNSRTDTLTTFEVLLNGSDNSIVFQYLNVGNSGLDTTALVGVQEDSANGLAYYAHSMQSPIALAVHDSLAIEFANLSPTAVEERAAIPTSFKVKQNYPNPFNPSTIIEYSIPNEENVTVDVYNVLGQRVAELFHGKEAPGTYSFRFDGSQFSSGVYFYRVAAGSQMMVKKMLLLK